MGEFYQQLANSPIASRENEAYPAITGAMGYGPNDSPAIDKV